MATKDDFTAEEWHLLATAPFTLSYGVSAADMSGPVGIAKEGYAVASALVETDRAAGTSSLVHAIIADVKARTVKPEPPRGEQARDVPGHAIARARQVAALLERKAPDESLAIRRWLHEVCVRVAKASNEGGFLGIGGVQVSAAEQQALDGLAAALGLTAGGAEQQAATAPQA